MRQFFGGCLVADEKRKNENKKKTNQNKIQMRKKSKFEQRIFQSIEPSSRSGESPSQDALAREDDADGFHNLYRS